MKCFALLIFGCLLFSCEGGPPEQSNANDSQFPFGLAAGDSIPLDVAIASYDSLSLGAHQDTLHSKEYYEKRLDSLKAALSNDPANHLLKFEIKHLEATIADRQLIEMMEDNLMQRDAMLNQLVPGFDSVVRAIQ